MRMVKRRAFLQGAALLGPGLFFCKNLASAQNNDDAEELKRNVLHLARLGGRSRETQEWLENSQIVRASKDNDFHGAFANGYEIDSDEPLEFDTRYRVRSVIGRAGVDENP